MYTVSRTPYRISFFGGGTDYPAWFGEHGGVVLGTTIDKYCYVLCGPRRKLPPSMPASLHQWRDLGSLFGPHLREIFRYLKVRSDLQVHFRHELPHMSGMGSSSSLIVGLVNALEGHCGRVLDKMELSRKSIFIEQKILKESVGHQDQVLAAFGGFELIEFKQSGEITVNPLSISLARLEELNGNLMLFFTGLPRSSYLYAKNIIRDIPEHKLELTLMKQMVWEAKAIICSKCDIYEFGHLLHQGWIMKKRLSKSISNSIIDEAYGRALEAGAIGGKLLGAGGGGFMLFFVPRERQLNVKMALSSLQYYPFAFERNGSQLVSGHPDTQMEAIHA